MKVKEVEALVGMNRANIRFYEKEGLLSPIREKDNNYREYTVEDVEILQRIKTLRVLGISIEDIRLLAEGKLSLDEVIRKRLESLDDEIRNLEMVKSVCGVILKGNLAFEDIEENILQVETKKEKRFWKERLTEILNEDITVEILTQQQLNTNIGIMLIYGFLLNALIAFFFGDILLNYKSASGLSDNAFFASIVFCLITIVVCNFSIYFTSSIKIQIVLFHFSALAMTPITSLIFWGIGTLYGEMPGADHVWINTDISGNVLAVFWLMVAGYILIRWIISVKWEKMYTKLRYTILMAFIFMIIVMGISYLTIGKCTAGCIASFVFSFYLGMTWFYACQNAQGRSRYYAVVCASRIMNIAGAAFSMQGKSVGGIVFR